MYFKKIASNEIVKKNENSYKMYKIESVPKLLILFSIIGNSQT